MATSPVTTSQSQTLPDQAGDSTRTIAVPEFDPSIGTLQYVAFDLSADVSGSFSILNLDGGPTNAIAYFGGEAILQMPDGSQIGTATIGNLLVMPNGAALVPGAATGVLTASSIGGTVLDIGANPAFVGTSTVALTVSEQTTVHLTGPANLSARTSASAGAGLTTSYTYVPATGSGSAGFGDFSEDTYNPLLFPYSSVFPLGSVTTAPQTVSIADARTGWNQGVSLQRFDPSLGTLETVDITLVTDIHGAVGLENTDSMPGTATVTDGANIALLRPDGTTLLDSWTPATDTASLGAYDGAIDWMGPSGFLDIGLAASGSASTTNFNPNDLALFTGTGDLNLSATGTGYSTVDGPGNLAVELRLNAGAEIQVSYTYIPAAVTSSNAVSCFTSGTRIRTARGDVAVEGLAVGDEVVTRDGRIAPVVWIGHRTVKPERHARPGDVRPVQVSAHAFGPGLPVRTLVLSPDHAIWYDNVLIPIRCLINGTSVRQVRVGRVAYWHVELAAHDVLLAENLACESFLDTGNRSAFAGGGACVQLHPDFAAPAREARCCAPLVVAGPLVAAARLVLAGRGRMAAG